MNQPISSLNLPMYLISKLENAGFSHCKDIKENFETIKTKIQIPNWPAVAEAPKQKTALELYEAEANFESIKSFIPELDAFLKSEIVPGCVTELCGFPGTGKTQICLHLAVGTVGPVVFIHTNKNLNSQRLREIGQKFHIDEAVLENILCIEANDPLELMASIRFLEGWLPENKNTKLLLIDSIAWPLKQQSFTERTNLICTFLQNLRTLTNSYNFPIVLTNTLTTRLTNGQSYNTSSFGDSFNHLINNRILLSKEGDSSHAKILKSLHWPFFFMEDKEVTEEFIKNEANTELDAVHPRFMEPQNAEVIRQYEVQNHYYCEECRLFFAPTVRGLKTHFSGDMVQHKPYASCFYCQGSVFEYKLNNERKFYHNCRDYKKEDSDKSD